MNYKLIGNVCSFLETIDLNGAEKISAAVLIIITAGIEGNTDGKISNDIQINKTSAFKTIKIVLENKDLIQMI